MSREATVAAFIESNGGRIFLLFRGSPVRREGPCVLFVPPFGEEMNKSRRQIAVTAKGLLDAGWSVLTVDPVGTGDSAGDFADATWDAWKANVATALRWADEKGAPVAAIVGVRLGCALAAESLQDCGRTVVQSVFWQPVDSGRQFMTQLLRLRVAASMMSDSVETVDGLRAQLERGESVDVAGYRLSSRLWRAIERVELSRALTPTLGRITILDVARSERVDQTPAAQWPTARRIIDAATRLGVTAEVSRVVGEPFWVATEIVTNPALASATVRCLAH